MKQADIKDDRTPEQKLTHTHLIGGTDSFLSGWGMAEDGKSYAAWACEEGIAMRVREWVANRGDMKRIREFSEGYCPSGPNDQYHIYVVTPTHPALA
jgi:hypothetical protein